MMKRFYGKDKGVKLISKKLFSKRVLTKKVFTNFAASNQYKDYHDGKSI